MTNTEVNKVIAEYMGYKYINYDELPEIQHVSGSSIHDVEGEILYRGSHFTLSLDALVPVWERLEVRHFEILSGIDGYYSVLNKDLFYSDDLHNTIQEAAAHATVKAILALG